MLHRRRVETQTKYPEYSEGVEGPKRVMGITKDKTRSIYGLQSLFLISFAIYESLNPFLNPDGVEDNRTTGDTESQEKLN